VKLRIDAWNEGRRRVSELYGELLEGVRVSSFPEVSEGTCFQYTIRLTQQTGTKSNPD